MVIVVHFPSVEDQIGGYGARIIQDEIFAGHHAFLQFLKPRPVLSALGPADGWRIVFDQEHIIENDSLFQLAVLELIELTSYF